MSTPHSTVPDIGRVDLGPSCRTTAGVQVTPSTAADPQAWSCAAVLRGVVTLAEQAPEPSDEQLRSQLVALGGLVR